jgi:cytochrome P450
MDFHAIMEVPLGMKHPRLGHLPEIASFVRTDKERRLLELWRVFRQVGSPYVLPPESPKDRVEILQDAMRKTLKDPEFHREFRKLVSDDVQPLMAEELTKIIRETPRDIEVIDLLKKLAGAGPSPPR